MENTPWKRRTGLFAPDQLREQDQALLWAWRGCTRGLGMTKQPNFAQLRMCRSGPSSCARHEALGSHQHLCLCPAHRGSLKPQSTMFSTTLEGTEVCVPMFFVSLPPLGKKLPSRSQPPLTLKRCQQAANGFAAVLPAEELR